MTWDEVKWVFGPEIEELLREARLKALDEANEVALEVMAADRTSDEIICATEISDKIIALKYKDE